MKGMTEFIKAHEKKLETASFDEDFLSYHLEQIRFLQHERLVHLLVMLFVMAAFLVFFVLFLLFQDMFIFGLFLLCLVLTIFYVFHYFKLENTVIKWYFIYNEKNQGDFNFSHKGTQRDTKKK
jgi:Ca2+/Na+ antiporter